MAMKKFGLIIGLSIQPPPPISASELLDKITDRMHPQIKKPIIDEYCD